LAGPEDTRLLHSLLRERCDAVGTSVSREGDRLVFTPSFTGSDPLT
jgi:hypothetical protein